MVGDIISGRRLYLHTKCIRMSQKCLRGIDKTLMTKKIRKTIFLVRSEVLTEMTMKSVILWDVTPFILFQRNLPPSPDYMQSHPRRQHCLTFLVAYINFTNNEFKGHTSMVHWQAHLSFEIESLVISTTLSSLEQNAFDKPEHVGGESICFLHCEMLI